MTEQAVNSEAIIYFTGHGISVKELFGAFQGYLATSDCEVSVGKDRKPIGQQNAIPFASLNSLVQGANLSSLVMLIDACHSVGCIEHKQYTSVRPLAYWFRGSGCIQNLWISVPVVIKGAPL